jgi:hypothetical protein
MRPTAFVVVVALASCGGAQKTTAPAASCVSLEAAQTEDQARTVRNRAALLAAVQGRGLTILELRPREVSIGGGGAGDYEWRSEPLPAGGTLVYAPLVEVTCGATPELEFVRDASGSVWALVPAPKAVARPDIVACACRSEQQVACASGAAPAPVQVVFDLAADLRFMGALPVEYDFEPVGILFTDRRDDGKPCPPMPDPPP